MRWKLGRAILGGATHRLKGFKSAWTKSQFHSPDRIEAVAATRDPKNGSSRDAARKGIDPLSKGWSHFSNGWGRCETVHFIPRRLGFLAVRRHSRGAPRDRRQQPHRLCTQIVSLLPPSPSTPRVRHHYSPLSMNTRYRRGSFLRDEGFQHAIVDDQLYCYQRRKQPFTMVIGMTLDGSRCVRWRWPMSAAMECFRTHLLGHGDRLT